MPMILFALSLSLFILFICTAAIARYYSSRMPSLSSERDYPLPDPPPKISILIPARNEQNKIESCVRSLLTSSYPRLEIFIYDDRSTDATRTIVEKLAAEDPRVRLIIGEEEPPPGCTGKVNAILRLVEKAQPTGEFWLFTDADTIHTPDGLRRIMSFTLQEKADFLSLNPRLRADTFWERVLEPAIWNTLLLSHNPVRANASSRPEDAIGYGPVLFSRSQAYRDIGGHAPVMGSMADDLSLAQTFRAQGYKTLFVQGFEVVSVRQYSSLAEIIRAWTNYYFPVLLYSLPRSILTFVIQVLKSTVPLLTLLFAIFSGKPLLLLYGIIQYATFLGFTIYLQSISSSYPLYGLLAPLSSGICAFILARSVLHYRMGQPLKWKGRAFIHSISGSPQNQSKSSPSSPVKGLTS
jgi:chlorobactene glucosyltransferase